MRLSNSVLGVMAGGVFAVLVILGALIFRLRFSEPDDTPPQPVDRTLGRPVPVPKPPPPPPKSWQEKVMEARSLKDAIRLASPHFENSVIKFSPGGAMLGLWAINHLTWGQLQAIPETTDALARKDIEAEAGKRICVRGSLIQIEAKRPDATRKDGKYFEALLSKGYGSNYFKLIAVKSTGKLVDGSAARFCGIVTEQHSFPNRAGGETGTLLLVGMFDLPENR